MGILSFQMLGQSKMMYTHTIQTKGKAVSIKVYKDGKKSVYEFHTREKSFQEAKKDCNQILKQMGIKYAV